ncbi:helix-turn-helix transcriptional regulator [Heyndrickxia faecalis]|uniref:helix-turn-helix transcriptional regulator n=1 Tax=Heyndrickxia TaxID=2837504 RepID=UPI002F3BA182
MADRLKDANMTPQEFANRLQVTRQQVHKYVKNERIMSLPIAKNSAEILNCEIGDLYEWIPVQYRSKRH